jgi:hypothetical protein
MGPNYCREMRGLFLLVAAVSLMTASCNREPTATINAASTATEIVQIEVSADGESVPTPQPGAPGSTTPDSSGTTVQTPASTSAPSDANAPSVEVTVQPTLQPTPQPIAANDNGEPVGDGPVLTTPPQPTEGDPTQSETPIEPTSSNGALAPVFFSFGATTTTRCDEADPGTITLQWEVAGTESVSVAIGTDSQIFRASQPPAGSLDIPLDCAAGGTYFVIAENPGGRTVRSATVAP